MYSIIYIWILYLIYCSAELRKRSSIVLKEIKYLRDVICQWKKNGFKSILYGISLVLTYSFFLFSYSYFSSYLLPNSFFFRIFSGRSKPLQSISYVFIRKKIVLGRFLVICSNQSANRRFKLPVRRAQTIKRINQISVSSTKMWCI